MRIGTRRSALALAQAELVAALLGGAEIVPIVTSGDLAAGPAGETGAEDKSRWVAELESALAAGDIDLAVHSAKDVPGELAQGLALLGAPARAAVEDVLCGASSLEELAPGARVGTSSIRRTAQLRSAREDLELVAIGGNVDTRLAKLADPGEGLQAIVLARAGLERLERGAEIGAPLDPARFVPAPGQGTLALEGRSGEAQIAQTVEAITDAETYACLLAERELAAELGASCHTPLGAYAVPAGCGCLHMRAWVGLPDGSSWIADELLGGFYDPRALGRDVARRMRSAGAAELLGEAEAAATGGRRPAEA